MPCQPRPGRWSLFLTGETNENGERLLQPQASILRGEMPQLLRQYDCLVEEPRPLYRFAAEDVTVNSGPERAKW